MTLRTEMRSGVVEERLSPAMFWIGIIFIAMLGLVLRSVRLEERSYTYDEVYEIQHLSTDFVEIARDPDGFPPLYRWLQSLEIEAFGQRSARWFPATLGVAVIVVTGFWGRILGGNGVGLSVSMMSALSAHQIEFSQQCRAYSFYMLTVALAMMACWNLRRKDSLSAWCWMLFSCFLALGTHYFAAFFIVQAWLFLLIEKAFSGWYRWLIAAVTFVVLCIPWIICLKIDLSSPFPDEWFNAFDFTGFAFTYLTLIEGWTVGPSQIELLELPTATAILAIAPWAIAAATCASILAWYGFVALERRASVLLFAMLALTPLATGLVALSLHMSFVSRYVAWLAVPFAVLVGAGMQWRHFSIRTIATYGLVFLNLLSTYNRLYVERYDRENYHALANYFVSEGSGKAVLILPHYTGQAAELDLPSNFPRTIMSLGAGETWDWDTQLDHLARQLKKDDLFYIVIEWLCSDDPRIEERDDLLRSLDAHFLKRISGTMLVYIASEGKLHQEMHKLKRSAPITSPVSKP